MRTYLVSLPLALAVLVGYGNIAPTSANPARDVRPPVAQRSDGDKFIELNDPLGARGTRAWGIDSEGDVVGSYDDVNKVRHGFFWRNGQFTTVDNPHAGHGSPGPLGPQGTTL